MRYFFSCLAAVLLSAAAVAADAPQGGNNSSESGRGSRRGGFMGGRRGGGFMEQIKKQHPKEFAEIEKLRQEKPEQAGIKMRELMTKMRGSSFGGRSRGGMPPMMAAPAVAEPAEEQLAVIKNKFPKEFAEYEKLKKSDPEKAKKLIIELMTKTFGAEAVFNPKNLRDRNRRAVSRVMMELKHRHPEKFAEIEKMQATDPDGARQELRKLFAESQMQMPGGMRELNYEYVDPKLKMQLQQRGGMGGFPPFGGRWGGMGGGFWGGRR